MSLKNENIELSLSVTLMAELNLALRKAGIDDREWTPRRIKRLVEKPELLADLLRVLSGQAQIKLIKRLVNLRKKPPAPPSSSRAPSKIYDHRKGSRCFELDFMKIGFLQPKSKIHYDFLKRQFSGEGIEDLSVCNATLLDYLLEHRESGLIPDEIRPCIYGGIVFLGTVYIDNVDSGFIGDEDEIDDDPTFVVRMLCWDNAQGWFWSFQEICKLDPNRILIAYHTK